MTLLLAWSIRQGGGSRLARIADALARQDADILVLSDIEAAKRRRVCSWRWIASAIDMRQSSRHRATAMACSSPLAAPSTSTARSPMDYRSLSDDERGIRLVPAERRYMPNLTAKIPYWEALIADLEPESSGHTLGIGDFKPCRRYLDEAGAIDPTARYTRSSGSGSAICGAAPIRRAANFPGSAPGATAFASTMLFCHMA